MIKASKPCKREAKFFLNLMRHESRTEWLCGRVTFHVDFTISSSVGITDCNSESKIFWRRKIILPVEVQERLVLQVIEGEVMFRRTAPFPHSPAAVTIITVAKLPSVSHCLQISLLLSLVQCCLRSHHKAMERSRVLDISVSILHLLIHHHHHWCLGTCY